MRRVLKGLILTLVLASVILPGLNYFLTSKVTLMVDQWIARLSPYARIHYQTINIDLLGSITLHQVSVELQQSQLPRQQVERLSIHFPTPLSLYRLALMEQENLLPKQLAIELEGAGLFFLENPLLVERYSSSNLELARILPSSCGQHYRFGPEELLAMGYSPSVLMNLSLAYHYDDFSQSLELSIGTEMQGIGFATLTTRLDNIPALSPAFLDSPGAELSQLTFRYQDDGFLTRRTAYCAARSRISPQQYIARETSRSDHYYGEVWGLIPGPSVQEAYRELLTQPGHLSVTARFQRNFHPTRIHPARLKAYQEQSWPQLQKLSMEVNNREIPAPELGLSPPQILSRLADLQTLLQLNAHSEQQPRTPVAPQEQPSPGTSVVDERAIYTGSHLNYTVIEKASLADYINRKIIIELNQGRVYEGTLAEFEKDRIKLKRIQSGGEAVLPIRLDRILTVKVLK